MSRIEIAKATTPPSQIGRSIMSDHNLSARFWVTAALVAVPFTSFTSFDSWLPLHMALLGAVTQAIVGGQLMFSATLGLSRGPSRRSTLTQLALLRSADGHHRASLRRADGPGIRRHRLPRRHLLGRLSDPPDVEDFGESTLFNRGDLLPSRGDQPAARSLDRRSTWHPWLRRRDVLPRSPWRPYDTERLRLGRDDHSRALQSRCCRPSCTFEPPVRRSSDPFRG